jgi:ferredoxin
MKIAVDKDKCLGCGMCVSSCPECFKMDGGTSSVVEGVESCDKCDLSQVADDCPAGAISVEED